MSVPIEHFAARAILRAWLHEFDARIEDRIDEEWERGFRTGQWRESVAEAIPPTRTIRIYGSLRNAITGLAVIAHEIGHIDLSHRGQLPAYVQEFEAEIFAKTLLERDGLRYPCKSEGRAYVRDWMYRGLRHGLRSVDPGIVRWAGLGGPYDWGKHDGRFERYRAAIKRRPPVNYYARGKARVAGRLGILP